MIYAIKTGYFKKIIQSAIIGALFALVALPSICAAAMFPFENETQTIAQQALSEKCEGLSMDSAPSGCYYPCKNPYKLKDGTHCCSDAEWLAMPEEYTRPEKENDCYDTDAVLAADGEYCYKQTLADTTCPEGFAWNDFSASYDKGQNYCACVAAKCPEGSSTQQKKGCYIYRDSGQKSGKNTCWISVPLNDKCPENQSKKPENCIYGYVLGETTECGSQCYKCNEPDNHCLAGQVKDSTDCLYGYTHGGRTQAGSQCYICKAPTCSFFELADECVEGCHDSMVTTCIAVNPKGTPLNCFEKITESCTQGCDGKKCAVKKCEDFGYADNCETGCSNGIKVTCTSKEPGFGLRCFEKIEEECAQGCYGNTCNVRTCETGGYVSKCEEGCVGNVNTTCRPVDYYGMLCYEKQVEDCAQGCSADGTTCNLKNCADGGYVDSCGNGCANGVMTTCTPQKYYGLSCYEKQTENCTQGCNENGSACRHKTCADGGYADSCQEGCTDNTSTKCTSVSYFGLTCFEKQTTTCPQGCSNDGINCVAKTCADGGYEESCKQGCRNNINTTCREVEYYGQTCYEKQTQTCKQGCAPDNLSCNIKTCKDGGYVDRCAAGCSGSAKTTCTEVEYYGLTCYDRQIETCAQGCAPDGKACIDKTCSDFADANGHKLTAYCVDGCAENTFVSCKAANPGYGLTCYVKSETQCQNGCAETDECALCPTGYTTQKTGQCYYMTAGANGKAVCYKETPCCANSERTFAMEKPLPEVGFDIVEAQGSQGGYCYKMKDCPEPETTSCARNISETKCTVCRETEHYSGSTQCQKSVELSNMCPTGQTQTPSDCENGYVEGNKTECGTQCYVCNLCPSGFTTRTGAKCYYSEVGADGKTMCYQNVDCCAEPNRVYSVGKPEPESGYDIVAAQGSQGGYCYKEKDCPEGESLTCAENIIETQCVVCEQTSNYSGKNKCQKKVTKSNICPSGQTKETAECLYGYEFGSKTDCGEQCYSCTVCPTGYSTGTTATCYVSEIGLDGVTTCYQETACCDGIERAYSATKPEPAVRFDIVAAHGVQGGYCYKIKK